MIRLIRYRRNTLTVKVLYGLFAVVAILFSFAGPLLVQCRASGGRVAARVLFQGCHLEEIDFYGAELQSVRFLRCVMTKAVWADATLTRCEMRETDISGAGNPERLRGVRMPWPDVLGAARELAAAAGIKIVE